MRSSLGRFHRPFSRVREEQLLLLNDLGDGSTLSLDFTTGILDPRLTFTRSTDATFINSNGLVQYADANHVRNSTMLVATSWTQNLTGTGAVTINGDGTVRFNGSGGRATWLQTVTSLASGLPMTFSFRVTAFTNNNLRTSDLFNVGTGLTPVAYSYTDTNGTTHSLGQFEALPRAGTNGLGVYSVTATTTSTSGNVIFGADCNSVGRLGDVTISEPQLQYGTVVPRRVYVPNASTSAANTNTPRFDHDPTAIGTPRGLLIEGSANNLVSRSETYSTGWSVSNLTIGASAVAPDGNSTATTLSATATAATWLYQSVGSVSGTSITLSMWVKQGTMSSVKFLVYDTTAAATRGETTYTFSTNSFSGTTGGGTPRSVSYANGWYRLEFPVTTHISGNGLACYFAFGAQTVTAGQTVILWGCQAETGIGASSYIPTGASTGSRAADSAVMSDIGPLNYSNTNGTLYWSGIINKQPTSFITLIGFMAATDQPTFETFGNGLSYFAAARGASLSTGGSNEAIRTYTLGTLIKYAASVDTITNPIIAVNLNGSAASTNKAGTGDLYAATRFVLGRQPVTPSHGTNYPSVTIANIKYWPTTKTATELAALTA